MKNPSQMSVNDLCLLSRQKITKTEEHKDKRAQDVYCLDRQKSTKTMLQRQKCAALGNLAMGRATIV